MGTLTGEALDPVITKSYTFNGKRVAMHTVVGGADTLVMLHGDHLGSASMTTDDIGGADDQMRLRGLYAPIRMERPAAARWRPTGASPGSGKRR
jgi:hypothetical protein